MTPLRRLRSYRRTLAGALGAGALVGAQVVGWPVHGVGAQTSQGFVPGTANATAQAIQLAPSTGGLGYNITLAESVADYLSTEGQAQSETFDPGALGLALTTQQCDGSPPPVKQSQLPQPAQAESNNGDVSQTKNSQGANGAAVGNETAEAKTSPAGSARTTLVGVHVPGIIDVSGGISTAEARLVDNKTRQATASSQMAQVSLLGGQVVLDGLRWQAIQSTGAGATQQGTFSVADLTVNGRKMSVSPDQISQSLDQANRVLAPTGFHLTPPAMSTTTSGTVLEGPLSVGIDSSALGQQVLGPGLAAAQPLRDAVANAVLQVNCRSAIPLLLSDLAVGPFAGGGGLDINLGGATAVTDGTAYANPFAVDLGGGLGGVSAGGEPLGDATSNGAQAAAGAAGGGPASAGTALAGQAPAAGAGPSATAGGAPPGAAALGAVTNASNKTGVGAALPVGLAALAVVVLLGALDFARARRARLFEAEAAKP